MIISKRDFLDRARLDPETLEVWIEEEWLVPGGTATDLAFSDADLARAQLIRDLMQDLGVNDEGVGVILHLLDQMHGERRWPTRSSPCASYPHHLTPARRCASIRTANDHSYVTRKDLCHD